VGSSAPLSIIQESSSVLYYALRKQTVEPVFGIIKSVMGFRQFLTRGPCHLSVSPNHQKRALGAA
jgi:hypothetical protein